VEKIADRKKAAVQALQKQQEQDMDVVCDICNDGKVYVKNQILFCESCNVSVHQFCYGVVSVPAGGWFCKGCCFLNRHEICLPRAETLREPLPLFCELFPQETGSFCEN